MEKTVLTNIHSMYTGFHSEGSMLGTRSYFIHFSGCNMKDLTGQYCTNCDNPYAQIKQNGSDKLLSEVYTKVKKHINLKNMCFTGGESLLHDKMLKMLIFAFGCDYKLQIETNGSIPFECKHYRFMDYMKSPLHFIISPKFRPTVKEDYPLRVFETMNMFQSTFEVKFTIDDSIKERHKRNIESIRDMYSIDPEYIWLVPQGKTKGEMDENMATVVQLAKEYDYNISPRLKIDYPNIS